MVFETFFYTIVLRLVMLSVRAFVCMCCKMLGMRVRPWAEMGSVPPKLAQAGTYSVVLIKFCDKNHASNTKSH